MQTCALLRFLRSFYAWWVKITDYVLVFNYYGFVWEWRKEVKHVPIFTKGLSQNVVFLLLMNNNFHV